MGQGLLSMGKGPISLPTCLRKHKAKSRGKRQPRKRVRKGPGRTEGAGRPCRSCRLMIALEEARGLSR